MLDSTLQDIRELFSRRGIRCTKQREEIYSALAASKSHPTAEELYGTVRQSQPGLSLATIYNTLEVFTRRGLCRRLPGNPAGPGGPCRFDADLSDHLHVVTSDGKVCDVPTDLGDEVLAHLPRDLMTKIERRMGVTLDRVSIEFIAAEPGGGRGLWPGPDDMAD